MLIYFIIIILLISLIILLTYTIRHNRNDKFFTGGSNGRKYYYAEDLRLAHEYHKKFDGINALKHYNNCLKNTTNDSNRSDNDIIVLMNIGSIFHYGIPNSIDINLLKAMQCYNILLELLKNKNDITSRIYKKKLNNKINQIQNELATSNNSKKNIDSDKYNISYSNISTADYMLYSILENFDKNNLFKNQQINTPRYDNRYNTTIINPVPINNLTNRNEINRNQIHVNDNNIDDNNTNDNNTNDNNNLDVIAADILYNPINIDLQNIHDTYINNTISNSINNILNQTNNSLHNGEDLHIINTPLQPHEVYKIIYEKLDTAKDTNNITTNKRDTIIRVIERIRNSDFKSIKNNMTLEELLLLVFNRINNKSIETNNPKIMDAFISNLLIELNDCIENHSIVCGTGIFNRIMNSINLLDEDVNIKSYDSLNSEIMNKCIVIRNNLELVLDSNSQNFNDKLKENIKEELNKDYIESKILTQNQLDDILKVWIDYI